MHDRTRVQQRILESLRRRNIGVRRAFAHDDADPHAAENPAGRALSVPAVTSASIAPTGMNTMSGVSPAASFFWISLITA